MITITDKAVEKLKEISEADEIGHFVVRVGIKGGGCAGYMTDMFFDDMIKDTDEIIEKGGVKIIVDEMSFQYLDGTDIDYEEGLMGSGFRFANPNKTGSCGCGKSFSV
jgi:iron-sulfur cluster insertion protein